MNRDSHKTLLIASLLGLLFMVIRDDSTAMVGFLFKRQSNVLQAWIWFTGKHHAKVIILSLCFTNTLGLRQCSSFSFGNSGNGWFLPYGQFGMVSLRLDSCLHEYGGYNGILFGTIKEYTDEHWTFNALAVVILLLVGRRIYTENESLKRPFESVQRELFELKNIVEVQKKRISVQNGDNKLIHQIRNKIIVITNGGRQKWFAEIDASGWDFSSMGSDLRAIVGYSLFRPLSVSTTTKSELAKDQRLMSNVLLQMLTKMSKDDDYFEELAKQSTRRMLSKNNSTK